MRIALPALACLIVACAAPPKGGVPHAAGPMPGEGARAPEEHRIAITLDDLPFLEEPAPGDTVESATARLLASLRERRVPAAGFVVCGRRPSDAGVLDAWLRAGFELGNHTTSHQAIDKTEPSAWLADVDACGAALEARTGRRPRLFRFPMLQSGATAERRDTARGALEERGYTTAHVSVDTSDWLFATAYADAARRGDASTKKAVGDAFVDHVDDAVAHYLEVARARLGRDASHVLLLHASALTADRMGEVLGRLSSRKFAFVSLADALADEVYQRPDGYAGGIGMSWLYRFAPADPDAWAWDVGRQRAAGARFGVKGEGLRAEKALTIERDIRARELSPHALVITVEKPYPSNALVVEMADGTLVLVSAPYSVERTKKIVAWLRARFGPRRAIAINGHFHDDAVGGNGALLAARIPVYASAETTRLIGERYPTVAKPDRLLPQGADPVLRFGTDSIEIVRPGPAHSPDNVAVWFPRERILFGGCMVLALGHVGNTADADLEHWPRAIEALRRYDPRYVIPGHGDRFDPTLLEETLEILARARAADRRTAPRTP